MALQAAYKQFLAAPSSNALAGNASLHYITSTTSYNGATDIIKHLNTLRNQVKRKKEDFLNVVEGGNGIAAEVDTSLEFITSGAAYLPALDDNFLSDRTVYLPIVHIVSFDADGKITQIRQSWDQGSLLKQLDIIGKTGRNWPIRDSTEQIRLIANSVKATAAATTAPAGEGSADLPVRSRGNSSINRDPHTSLSLFGSREEMSSIPQSVVSPYAGSRPRQRDFAEIFGDEPAEENTPRAGVVSPYAGTRPRQRDFAEILGDQAEEAPSPSSGRERAESQGKAIAPKIGAGKNFQPSRLFETEEGVEINPDTPEKGKPDHKFYKPHPTKFKHFDFADGSEPQDAPQRGFTTEQAPKTKHGSGWSFDDFTTPAKPTAASKATRAQDVRHWGTENDEVPETPARKPAPPKPRKDVEPQFEFRDDGVPAGDHDTRATRPRGASHNTNMGLYENNLYNEDGSAPAAGPGGRALGNITNIKDRSKIFDPHFEYTDDPTHGSGAPKPSAGENRAKVVKMMESNWGAYDESPAQKENNPITGNGSSAPEGHRIQIMGDGMGGKKAGGSGRGWAIGDESDEERSTKAVPGKKPGAGQKAGGGFWDF